MMNNEKTLKERVLAFAKHELPGTPKIVRLGARKLVGDLMARVEELEAKADEPLPVNRCGVDAPYFTKNLNILIRDIASYTPMELGRALENLSSVAYGTGREQNDE